jgi:hypothetical protein
VTREEALEFLRRFEDVEIPACVHCGRVMLAGRCCEKAGTTLAGVNWLYRNVINPHQTPKEIKIAEKFITKMIKDMPWEERERLLHTDGPDRAW